jgi:Ca2+-binding EF-hand superfamily protein
MRINMKTTILIAGIVAGLSLTAVSAQAERGGERPDFATLDINGDGEVTKEELEAQGAARFAATDADGSGALSEVELAAQANDRAFDRISKMIERLDTNEDGELQQSELEEGREGRRSRGSDMFERIDTDENGSISQEEFDNAKERRGGHRRHGGKGPRDGAADEG